jgi:hypothetical protein
MATFTRKLEQTVKLTESNLWINRLEKDCKEQNVFLAIRDNNIGFYHRGGKLFGFDDKSQFKTHIKYAAVIDDADEEKSYLTANELKNKALIPDFATKYERIKENCKNYARVEAQGVSEIYHTHSYLSDGDIVVLDIEVSFESSNKSKTQDRIDILLFDKKSCTLRFVEAKHYSNGAITSKKGKKPTVVEQIKDYEKQIASRGVEIIEAYKKYIAAINQLFGKNLPEPIDVDEKVTLLIFGFDKDQEQGRLKNVKEKLKKFGVFCASIGNTKSVTQKTLQKYKK